MERSLRIWLKLGNTYQASRVESNMGTAYLYLGQLDKARKAYESSLKYWQKFANQEKEAIMLAHLALVSYTLGQCKEMASYSQEDIDQTYQNAINYNSQAVEISQELNNLVR